MLRASTSRVRPPIAEVWLADDGRIRGIFGDPVIGEPIRASVFDSLGRWEGDLELPPDLVLNQIDGDGLLATFIDPDGFAEVRIPFSQLRFTAAGTQTWGIQINRWMPHANEDVYWVMIPKNETGWASRFGLLTGIEGVRPSRRMELLPYVAANATFEDAPSADPFNDGSEYKARAGADF